MDERRSGARGTDRPAVLGREPELAAAVGQVDRDVRHPQRLGHGLDRGGQHVARQQHGLQPGSQVVQHPGRIVSMRRTSAG